MYEIKNGSIYLYLKVQPNSSINKMHGLYDGVMKINIKAPPVEGAANKELIKFLSKEFKIPKSSIKIKGEASKRKTVQMPYSDFIVEKLEKIKSEKG